MFKISRILLQQFPVIVVIGGEEEESQVEQYKGH